MKNTIILLLILALSVTGFIHGIKGYIKETESKYCELGEEVIKDGRLLGCELENGYIIDYEYDYNFSFFEGMCIIFCLSGSLLSAVLLILVFIDDCNY